MRLQQSPRLCYRFFTFWYWRSENRIGWRFIWINSESSLRIWMKTNYYCGPKKKETRFSNDTTKVEMVTVWLIHGKKRNLKYIIALIGECHFSSVLSGGGSQKCVSKIKLSLWMQIHGHEFVNKKKMLSRSWTPEMSRTINKQFFLISDMDSFRAIEMQTTIITV